MPSQRKIDTLTFLVIISVCVAIPAFAFQNEPDGFRGIKWGTNISELPDMRLAEDTGDLKYYSRKDDETRIGNTDIQRISYGFYKNRFCTVRIECSGFLNFTSLKASLFDQYGSGYKPFSQLEDYSWTGSTVDISMTYNDIFDKGKIVFFFVPIKEEKRADDIQRAKGGAKDL